MSVFSIPRPSQEIVIWKQLINPYSSVCSSFANTQNCMDFIVLFYIIIYLVCIFLGLSSYPVRITNHYQMIAIRQATVDQVSKDEVITL